MVIFLLQVLDEILANLLGYLIHHVGIRIGGTIWGPAFPGRWFLFLPFQFIRIWFVLQGGRKSLLVQLHFPGPATVAGLFPQFLFFLNRFVGIFGTEHVTEVIIIITVLRV